ncbi:MAG: FAD-binding oxidoreductase, partial [Deltaproteobacteria bacterium]|nr:FAD-binding oxidoreductase [Deltaproteobacteria bacterium]
MENQLSLTETTARDLKTLLRGEVLWDDLSRAAYSSAACIYRLLPLMIVQPKHQEDVIQCVRYAASKGISITARGAGTGRAGQGIGEGILLDFVRHMNKILEIDPQGNWVRVQPGVILGTLNTVLKPLGKFFPNDPSTGDYCTLGGMIDNNSSGPHAVKYGATRDYVESLEVVLSSGEVIVTGSRSLKDFDLLPADGLERKIFHGVSDLLKRYQAPLRAERPQSTKNSCGYDLWQVGKNDSLDLTPLLVGSEGTLGIFTEARLRLVDLPRRTHSALF